MVITLSASNVHEGTARVTLAIQDTGIGMSRQFVAIDLFRPDKQADYNQTRTGLGASIMEEIARNLRAVLDV